MEPAALYTAKKTEYQNFLLSSGALAAVAAFALATLFVISKYNAAFTKSTLSKVAVPLSSIFLSIGGGGILYFSYSLYKIKQTYLKTLRSNQNISRELNSPSVHPRQIPSAQEGAVESPKTPRIIQLEKDIAKAEQHLRDLKNSNADDEDLEKEETTITTLRENLAAAKCMALQYNQLLNKFPPLLKPALQEAGVLYDILTDHCVRVFKALPAHANKPLTTNFDTLQEILDAIKKLALQKLYESYTSDLTQYNIQEADSYLKKYDQIRLKSAEKLFIKAEKRYSELSEKERTQSEREYHILTENQERLALAIGEAERDYKHVLRKYKDRRASREDFEQARSVLLEHTNEAKRIRLDLDVNEHAMFIKAETSLKTYRERCKIESLVERTLLSLLEYLPANTPGLHLLKHPFATLQEPLPSFISHSTRTKSSLLVLADKLEEFIDEPPELSKLLPQFIPQLENSPVLSRLIAGIATSRFAEIVIPYFLSKLDNTLETAKVEVGKMIDDAIAELLEDRGFQLQYSTPETRAFITQIQGLLKEIISSYIDMLKSEEGFNNLARRDFIKAQGLSFIRAIPDHLRSLASTEEGPLTSKLMQEAIAQGPLATFISNLEETQIPLPIDAAAAV